MRPRLPLCNRHRHEPTGASPKRAWRENPPLPRECQTRAADARKRPRKIRCGGTRKSIPDALMRARREVLHILGRRKGTGNVSDEARDRVSWAEGSHHRGMGPDYHVTASITSATFRSPPLPRREEGSCCQRGRWFKRPTTVNPDKKKKVTGTQEAPQGDELYLATG